MVTVIPVLRSTLLKLVLVYCGTLPLWGLPSIIRIGGVFDATEDDQELALQIAVDWINEDLSILPRSNLVVHRIIYQPDDCFEVSRKVCKLLPLGVAGIFGPRSPLAALHVQSISDAAEVPHVESRWDYRLSRDDLSINLHPRSALLNLAYMDIVRYWKWNRFVIVYEESEGIVRLQDFLKESYNHGWDVQVYQFRKDEPYRNLFREIRASSTHKWPGDDICILLDVATKHLKNVFKQAQQVEMMTVRNKYVVTSLDLHTIDLEDFQYSRANITGFKIVNTDEEQYFELLNETNYRLRKMKRKPVASITTASGLMYDAVMLFARALQDLDNGKQVNEFPPMYCDHITKGTDGTSLINYMKSNKIQGLTGLVHFDGQGFRSSFTLDIMQLSNAGIKKIGTLFPGRYINVTETIPPDEPPGYHLEHRKYIVTTILNKPFAMLKESTRQLSGNERYEGFSIDLIEELSKLLHFSYEIREVVDNKYGVEVKEGVWNGMIGEVLRGEADMAIADVTITSTREKVLDFTLPFMNTGISILYKRPTEKVKSLFSFLSPFSAEVWIYVVAAFLGVSFVLFVVGRLSPYEWENSNPCRREEERTEENCFNLLNSMWFTIASVMQQGCEVTPRSSSTRTVAGIWYFFTLIMISSYTANLAAFLTIEKAVYPIESAEDLSKQTKIKYGCLSSGSTRTFFESSSISTYKRMWEFMRRNPSVLMESNEKGKQKVYSGNYAYLMESASIQFITERECNLTQIGGLLDHKGYGIATKKGNGSLSSWLSGGILQLQEEGILHTLRERWWKQRRGGGRCVEAPSGTVRELGLSNVGGVFVVLLAGVLVASAVATLEFFWKFRRYSDSKVDLGKMMMRDIRFALTCSSSVKKVPRPKKESHNSQSTMSDVNDIGRYAMYRRQ